MNNVLVTGATTPLGRAVIERLSALPETGFVLAIGHEQDPRTLEPSPRLAYRVVDLTRARAVHDLLWGPAREHRVDTVIHCAQHRNAGDHGRAVHAQNVEAMRELVLGLADHPTITRFVLRSFAEVYALRHTTSDVLDEEAPLDFDPAAPQWVRDRVEADLVALAHLGGRLQIAVLRCAEILAPESGSQLWDYLQSRVCLRPLGFDPMLNVLSLDDAADALLAAARSRATGAFNITGADTLPLSEAIERSICIDVPVPGPLMSPLYRLRRLVAGFEFRYEMNMRRFHFGGVLDGSRARRELGYVPRSRVHWPRPWWRELIDRVVEARW